MIDWHITISFQKFLINFELTYHNLVKPIGVAARGGRGFRGSEEPPLGVQIMPVNKYTHIYTCILAYFIIKGRNT